MPRGRTVEKGLAEMDREHYCTECGDLRDAPGVCPACVTFELVDLTEREARTAEA